MENFLKTVEGASLTYADRELIWSSVYGWRVFDSSPAIGRGTRHTNLISTEKLDEALYVLQYGKPIARSRKVMVITSGSVVNEIEMRAADIVVSTNGREYMVLKNRTGRTGVFSKDEFSELVFG